MGSFDRLTRNNTLLAANAGGTAEERRAARLAAIHADTPAVTHLDSLGREVVAITHDMMNAKSIG